MTHEVQRLANTVPLSVPHSTTKDTELLGYSIPRVSGQWLLFVDGNPNVITWTNQGRVHQRL